MKKIWRNLLVFFLLFFISLIVFFPFDSISARVKDELEYQARESKILLNIEDLALGFPLVAKAKGVSALIPLDKLPLPFYAKDVVLRGHLLSLFLLRATLSTDAQLYGGRVWAEISKPLFADNAQLEMLIENLEIGEHPALKAIGVAGKLDLEGQTDIAPGGQSEGNLKLELKNAAYRGDLKVLIAKIPEVSDLNLLLDTRHRGTGIILETCQLTSSLGSAHASGTLRFKERKDPQNPLSAANISARIDLSPQGREKLGGYLALAANSSPDNPPSRWSISIMQKPGDRTPRVMVRPSGK